MISSHSARETPYCFDNPPKEWGKFSFNLGFEKEFDFERKRAPIAIIAVSVFLSFYLSCYNIL